MLNFSVNRVEVFQNTNITPFVLRIFASDSEFDNFEVKIATEPAEGYFVLVKRVESELFKAIEEFSTLSKEFCFDVKIERYSPFFNAIENMKILVTQKIGGETFLYEIPIVVFNKPISTLEKYLIDKTFAGKKIAIKVIPGSVLKLRAAFLFPYSFSVARIGIQQLNFNGFVVSEQEIELDLQNGFAIKDLEIEIDQGARFLVAYGDYCLGVGILEERYEDIGRHLAAELIYGWLPRYFRNEEYRRFISLLTLPLNDILYFTNNLSDLFKLNQFPLYLVRDLGRLYDFYVPNDRNAVMSLVPLLLSSRLAGTTQQIDLIMKYLYSGVDYEIDIHDNEVYIYIESGYDENRDPLAYSILRQLGAAHVKYNLVFNQVSFIIGVSDYLEVYTYLR